MRVSFRAGDPRIQSDALGDPFRWRQSLGTDHFHGPKVADKGRRQRSHVEVRPETEFQQEPEIENPAEIEVSVSTICEWDLGATGPITAENRQK